MKGPVVQIHEGLEGNNFSSRRDCRAARCFSKGRLPKRGVNLQVNQHAYFSFIMKDWEV